MNTLSFFLAAYIVVWLATTFYLVLLSGRQRDILRQLEKLNGEKP
jgi:CcmD family protein